MQLRMVCPEHDVDGNTYLDLGDNVVFEPPLAASSELNGKKTSRMLAVIKKCPVRDCPNTVRFFIEVSWQASWMPEKSPEVMLTAQEGERP